MNKTISIMLMFGYVLCTVPLAIMLFNWVNSDGSGCADVMLILKLVANVAILLAWCIGGHIFLHIIGERIQDHKQYYPTRIAAQKHRQIGERIWYTPKKGYYITEGDE